MNQTRDAVAVGPTRDEASKVFARIFDTARFEQYPDLSLDDLTPVLALAGGARQLEIADLVLSGTRPDITELHLQLASEEIRDAVAGRLASAPGWVVTDIHRVPGGSPVLTVSAGQPAEALPLSLAALPTAPGEEAAADWPSATAAPLTGNGAATPAERPQATAPHRRGVRLGRRARSAAGALLLVALVAALALVLIGVLGGFRALVVALLTGIAAMAALTLVGVAYAVRALLRVQHTQSAHGDVGERTLRHLQRAMTQATTRHGLSRETALATQADVKVQGEYLATLAGQLATERAVDRERKRLDDPRAHLATQRQIQALMHLDATVRPPFVPPMGGWAASPDLLALCLDLFIERRPTCVVETGSGISTLYFAAAADRYDIDCRIVSLEHCEKYAQATRELLARNGLAHRAEVRLAPLADAGLAGHDTGWYDPAALADLSEIGLLLVDGPPETTGADARYPAGPLLHDRLAERCVIVADDVIRPSDLRAVERWLAEDLTGFEHVLRDDLLKHASVLRRG